MFLVWFWFGSSLGGLVVEMKRTSEPPHYWSFGFDVRIEQSRRMSSERQIRSTSSSAPRQRALDDGSGSNGRVSRLRGKFVDQAIGFAGNVVGGLQHQPLERPAVG